MPRRVKKPPLTGGAEGADLEQGEFKERPGFFAGVEPVGGEQGDGGEERSMVISVAERAWSPKISRT